MPQRDQSGSSDGNHVPRTRIVLVDDHVIFRDSLKALMQTDCEMAVVAEYSSVEESLEGIRKLQPDLLVTDLALPRRSGLELIRDLPHLSPLTRRLVLTAHESEECVKAALIAGADGYVLKSSAYAELICAIRAVLLGQRFICHAIGGECSLDVPALKRRAPFTEADTPITGREREVLIHIAIGSSTKAIARDLGVSTKTIEKHRANLMRKLHLHSSAAVTMFAIRNGLTDTVGGISSSALRELFL